MAAGPAAPDTETPAWKDERKQVAYQTLLMRFSVAAALTVPVMVLGMSDHLGLHVPRPVSLWLQLLLDRKSTRLNSSHGYISYAVFCLKKKKRIPKQSYQPHSRPLPAPLTNLDPFPTLPYLL